MEVGRGKATEVGQCDGGGARGEAGWGEATGGVASDGGGADLLICL
jgi:hypothetical protein